MLQHDLQHVQPDSVPPQSPDTHFQALDHQAPTVSGDIPEPNPPNPVASTLPPNAPKGPTFFDEGTINPPQVQKVIVEHFIRSDATPSSYSQSRVRTFSGRLPKPSGEVDYDAWRIQVDLLLNDASLSDSQKVRRILESLLSPAADIVKPLIYMQPLRLTSLSLNQHLAW